MEKYFYEAFDGMSRLAPGSQHSTLQAIAKIPTDKAIKILDIGCGEGTHTFTVAEALPNAEIIAIDNNSCYIEELNLRARRLGVDKRVSGRCVSMFEMNFQPSSFDYIVAEGAIYIAGFAQGLKDWKKLLKRGGAIICSEISWLVGSPSPEVRKYWEEAYPGIDTTEHKIEIAEKLGYSCHNTFVLPTECWTKNYYEPLQENLNKMKIKYDSNSEAKQVIEAIEEEIDIYNRYGSEYSYVFYELVLN